MAESPSAAGSAADAIVSTAPAAAGDDLAYRQTLAAEAEAAVKTIEKQLAGIKEALAAKKAEAKALRADAEKGE